ncbi:helix-turn-helix domain-containing protein [Paraburkholderia sp.]|uniref:GlxA family transcriptional regulator n=1 Tax=Paraburkholderia sp. TaxID=1926495 RepID=UPI00239EB22A|nr:helix-turn-helix domain-containing protein [Paraburkholderia sp.]MDE1183039.1 helix-turn-helix domain-containing protein [Paraburkholderia sp.]
MQEKNVMIRSRAKSPVAHGNPAGIVRAAKRIGILVFDGFPLSDVSSIAEAFRLANEAHVAQTGADVPYSVVMLSEHGGSVASQCSLQVWTDSLNGPLLGGFDTLFIAGGPGAARARFNSTFLGRLRAIAPQVGIVKALGEGRALLAAADLSVGRGSITTASVRSTQWRALPGDYANTAIDSPRGPIVAALTVIRRDHGTSMAQLISERSAPGAWRRLGVMLDDAESDALSGRINTAASWLRSNYGKLISVSDAAQVAQMSERSFLRRFKTQMGLTPSEYLLRARLDASCLLLTGTDLPIDAIARRCGMRSGDGLAKIFRRRLSISPTRYRTANRNSKNAAADEREHADATAA